MEKFASKDEQNYQNYIDILWGLMYEEAIVTIGPKKLKKILEIQGHVVVKAVGTELVIIDDAEEKNSA